MNLPVAIVTGASSGIGEAVAKTLARNGFRVVLAARRKDRLNKIASQIIEQGGTVLSVPTDLSIMVEIQQLVDKTIQTFGQIDILVNSAGFGKLVWLDQQSLEEIQSQIQVNLIGAIQISRAVLPFMLKQDQGQIIHITSISSFVGLPTYSIYTATKFGLRGFLESLRREMRGTGITITGFYPGAVDTEFDQHAGVHWKITRVTPDWLLLSPDAVAKMILRVIQKKRRNMVVPGIMWVPILANTLFPRLVSWIVSRLFYRESGKTVAWRNQEE